MLRLRLVASTHSPSSTSSVGRMSALASVLSAARSSWDSNYTIGDPRWRITQLYQLYQLLMDNRDQLVEDFSRGSKVKDYSQHMRLLNQCTNSHPK